MTGDATAMSHDDLITALRRQLPGTLLVSRQALQLLLDHDGGVWFTDPVLVNKVVADATDTSPVRVDFAKLAELRDDARRGAVWTYRHGPRGSVVLWLACELAGGRLGELRDADTDGPIASLFTWLLQPPPPGAQGTE